MHRILYNKKKRNVLVAVLVMFILVLSLFLFRITEIQVTGNTKYSNAAIGEMVFESGIEKITVIAYLRELFLPHKELPLIQSYELSFENMHTVELVIYEKGLIGCVEYMGTYFFFDKDGNVIESSTERREEIPVIEGIVFHKIGVNQKLEAKQANIFASILTLTQMLQAHQIMPKQITYDVNGDVTITLGVVRVALGGNQFMEGKIADLNDIMNSAQWKDVQGISGTLHMENYEDASTNSKPYTFERDYVDEPGTEALQEEQSIVP